MGHPMLGLVGSTTLLRSHHRLIAQTHWTVERTGLIIHPAIWAKHEDQPTVLPSNRTAILHFIITMKLKGSFSCLLPTCQGWHLDKCSSVKSFLSDAAHCASTSGLGSVAGSGLGSVTAEAFVLVEELLNHQESQPQSINLWKNCNYWRALSGGRKTFTNVTQ